MLAAGHAQAKQPVQGSGRVVIVHGLPAEVSEEDIIPHANKVGAVRKRFVQEKNRHVFIEMDSHHQATALVQLLTQILVKGHQLRAELSSRYPQVHEEKVNKVLVLTMPGLSDGQTDCHRLGNLFRSKGVVVRKIQLWSKDGLVSGLVETDSNRSAKLLREQLSGYSMDGAILRLSYSNKESIEIKQLQFGCNFETGEGAGDCPKAGPPPGQQWPPAQPANHHQQPPPPPPPPPGNSRHAYPVGSGQRGQAADAHSHALRTTHEAYDGSGGGYHNGANPYPAPAYIDPIHSHGGKKGGPAPWAAPPAAAPAACVVTVKCLLDGTSPDAVFRLFGICGDVRAVKITKARTTALVQYATPEGAQNAVDRLNDCPWYYETRCVPTPGLQ
ncbi:Polypyrimidine tract-binding protein-like protein 3 [Diplonema papillatum]|nr:Polypyrimidine tract-binding protein-like protein 3 [Diplonema papillatum]